MSTKVCVYKNAQNDVRYVYGAPIPFKASETEKHAEAKRIVEADVERKEKEAAAKAAILQQS